MTKRELRIVVASPGDVQAERDSLDTVAAELNRGMADVFGLRIEIARWETDAFPGFHLDGPQGLIDSILRIDEADVVIGIFWKRFGTPVADANSGTEHELRLAYQSWRATGRPQIMVYFNQKPYKPRSKTETDQWGQVLEFQRNFPKEGLWWSYQGKAQFETLVRNHLTQFIRSQQDKAHRSNQAQPILVDLFTFPELHYAEPALERLNWFSYFNPHLPTPETWQTILLPELQSLRERLGRTYASPVTIALRPKAHLSVGYALGYAFRAPAGIRFLIEQTTSNRVAWWDTAADRAGEQPLVLEEEIVNPAGSDITVELNITQNVRRSVDQWLNQSNLTIRKRLMLTPRESAGDTSVLDSAHALAIAYQVRRAILKERADSKVVHLFGALPFALGVFIGMYLNTCGPIQCYEFDKEARTYQLACRLP